MTQFAQGFSGAETFACLSRELGNQLEVLVEVKDGQTREFLSSMAGIRYSTGIIEMGGVANTERASPAVRAECPTSSRVMVVILTRPRSMRPAHVAASGLLPSRTRADLSISQSVTATPRPSPRRSPGRRTCRRSLGGHPPRPGRWRWLRQRPAVCGCTRHTRDSQSGRVGVDSGQHGVGDVTDQHVSHLDHRGGPRMGSGGRGVVVSFRRA
jgi:hypothetical protein